MQETIKRVTSVVFAMMAITAAAELKWFNPATAVGGNFWSEATGWQNTQTLPTLTDYVALDNALTTPENPLVIADGTDAVCSSLRIAAHATANYVGDGRIPSLHMSGGSLHTTSLLWDGISVGEHTNGFGLLTLSGGMISNQNLTVGANGIGVMTNDGGVVELAGELCIGLRTTGRGTYVQQSGAFQGGMNVGYDGTGTLIYTGGTMTHQGYLYVGRNPASEGLLDVRAPGICTQGGQTFIIGYEGRGVLEQHADLSVDYLKIGGSTNVTSIATIYAGAINHVSLSCNIGGYLMPGGINKPGNGTLLLKGGVLKISSSSSDTNPNLYVGRLAESCGRIQGWGTVAPSLPGATNVRILNGNGVIQGDGEGEARTLDLHQVVNVINNLPNSAEGTNGWYAVNKGRVLYPRGWFDNASSTVTCCIGDPRYNTAPDLINSVCATFTGITSGANFLRGGLYAPDREDIPAGLSKNGTTVGLWQLGLYRDLDTWSASQAQPFTSVKVTFRYDQTRVKSHQSLTLYRYTGNTWVRVGGGAVTPNHCISTTIPLNNLSGADANIGWFALVARNSGEGTLVMIKGAITEPLPAEQAYVSGIYPHLAMYNYEAECGTGAVVAWADRLWAITYGPHCPNGSSDKLYEITPALQQIVRSESVGGTHANRMLHRESQQLFIGPYAVDANRTVRTIPTSTLFGRLTGNARHLSDPATKIYYATMEEGFYEVDVNTLAVTELYKDGNARQGDSGDSLLQLPGNHGKGFYLGQGRVIYSNNGEPGSLALTDPSITAGVLAEWGGAGSEWQVVRRNQFTEVTGPGGIWGNSNPTQDPVWSIGWDHRSLILMVLHQGAWHCYRLPKGCHSYDGAHGWNTEWPRIRDIGATDLLMTMHGTFWSFPVDFTSAHAVGITPRSNYLRVIGDFCRWKERVVFGCDDSAKSEFLNKRNIKGDLHGSGQSHSNLWFVEPEKLDALGPLIGRGALWVNEGVNAEEASDPYLFDGYEQRSLWLAHSATSTVHFRVEIDHDGNGQWQTLRDLTVPPGQLTLAQFEPSVRGAWLRLVAISGASGVTASFHYAGTDKRRPEADQIFDGIAVSETSVGWGGLVYARGADRRTLGLAASYADADDAQDVGFYELDSELHLRRSQEQGAFEYVHANYAIKDNSGLVDEASALVIDDAGRRWRFPKAAGADAQPGLWGHERACREVCTERDLLNLCGIFYLLPAENAGGFAKARAISTHGQRVHDYCSYRGLLVLTGIDAAAPVTGHIIRADDNQAAVWVGGIDDLWAFGKPRGEGGPWKRSAVRAGEPSDPYLMTGFDQKLLTLSHELAEQVTFAVELDVTGDGQWHLFETFCVENGEAANLDLSHISAYWLRVRINRDCTATAWLIYE